MSLLWAPIWDSCSSLQEELDHFLEFGLLREEYVLTSEIEPVKIGQYDGLEISVEREATEMFIAMKGIINITRTDSGVLYALIATAPTEQWGSSFPLFLAILQDMEFFE